MVWFENGFYFRGVRNKKLGMKLFLWIVGGCGLKNWATLNLPYL
jgi:hypothetical protein